MFEAAELVKDASKRPYISLVRIALAGMDFRSHVEGRSHVRLANFCTLEAFGNHEIAQLHEAIAKQKNIVSLNVSMHDAVLV